MVFLATDHSGPSVTIVSLTDIRIPNHPSRLWTQGESKVDLWLQESHPKQPKAVQKAEKAAQGGRLEEEEEEAAPPASEPALHQAARHGDEELVTRLLREGQDPTVSVGTQTPWVGRGV